MTEPMTVIQRIVLWVLHTALFFLVAIYPSYQMATIFDADVLSTVLYRFLGAMVVMLAAYAIAAKVFFKNA